MSRSAGASSLAYQDTAVGRLPRGPAADAALAAAAVRGPAADAALATAAAPAVSEAGVPGRGGAGRGAALERLVPALAVALATAVALVLKRRSTS